MVVISFTKVKMIEGWVGVFWYLRVEINKELIIQKGREKASFQNNKKMDEFFSEQLLRTLANHRAWLKWAI